MISMENMRWAVFENGNGGMTHSLQQQQQQQQQPPWMQNKSSIEQTAVVSFLSPPPPVPFTIPTPNSDYDSNSLESKISPSILWIIIILAVIFFVSGLLHLLVRFLVRPVIRRVEDEVDNVTVLQGQLQQLFHLHDAGVDQSFIDTLPVFLYKTIIGVKSPFDCAVCLCEFEGEDKLRLLPKCSHAFHLDCIDTWLLSHSTCPLCRGSLLTDYTSTNINSPIVLVLESAGSESSREIVDHRQDTSCNPAAAVISRANSCLPTEERFGSCRSLGNKEKVILMDEIPTVPLPPAGEDVKVVSIKLGKLKKEVASSQSGIISGRGETSCNVNSRRCYSMGSYEYVLDETSLLQVPIHPTARKNSIKKAAGSHRPTISMYEIPKISSQTKRDHEASNSGVIIHEGRKESYSISKTWLRSKKETRGGASNYSSRRDFSFRFPAVKEDQEDRKLKQYTSSRRSNWSEIEVENWANSQRYAISVMEGGRSSEFGMEDGLGRSFRSTDSHHWNNNLRSESFAKRTLNWIIGRQNKVVHSSSAPAPAPPPPV